MASLSGARIVKEVPGGVSLDASVRKGWNKLNLRLTTRFRTSLCVHCDHQTREKMDRKHTCRYENMPFHGPTREEVKDLKMANIKEPVTLHALEEQHKARLEQSRSVSLVKSHLRCGYCTLCKYGVAHLSESPWAAIHYPIRPRVLITSSSCRKRRRKCWSHTARWHVGKTWEWLFTQCGWAPTTF
jgi:hypothetical protein